MENVVALMHAKGEKMARLEGKVALVTGAGRGIGAAIARRLASDGAKVVVNYNRSAGPAEAVVEDIRADGGEAAALQADVANLDEAEWLPARAVDAFGRLDVVVNNAAVAEFRPLDAITADHFDRQFALNVRGLLFLTRAAAPLLPSGGRIINITSGAAEAGSPSASVYAATKAAVQALSKSLAAELGPRGITVNCVSPGLTDTEMLHANMPPDVQGALIRVTPLGRLGTPAEIADVVAFLASEDARWITGQVIRANGGLS
jgi:3-oxoacyl-[acyl-carrier protein] reductase